MKHKKQAYIRSMAMIAMCTSVIIISAWIAIPFAVNITMQLAAIFVVSLLFELKTSLISILLYIFIGICGLPVFSGYNSGLSALLGPSGGFIISFIFIPPVITIFKKTKKSIKAMSVFAMLLCLIICYFVGTLWYWKIYANNSNIRMFDAFAVCVLPFIVPDLLKILLSSIVSSKLYKHIK